jgi:lysophospholipase L1-like esterase
MANVYFVSQLRRFYAEKLLAQIHPSGLPQAPRVTGELHHFTSTVLLFGDSRTAAWAVSPLSGGRLVTAGINGATTAQLRLRLPFLLKEYKPDVVIFQAGINDLKLAGVRPECTMELVAQAVTNLEAMTKECLAHQSKVILLYVWPPGSPEWLRLPVWSSQIPRAVTNLNLRLNGLSSTNHDLFVVDLLAEHDCQPTSGDYLDALHFRPEFYKQLTPKLEQWVWIAQRSEKQPVAGDQYREK